MLVALVVDIVCVTIVAFVALLAYALVAKRERDDGVALIDADTRVILVEGNIGAGKTTFVRALSAENSSASVVVESIGKQFLTTFYRRPREYAFALQMTQHAMRSTTLSLLYRDREQCNVFDRSVLGDYAFALWNHAIGNLTPHQWRLYREQAGSTIVDVLANVDCATTCVVFLADTTDACSSRQEQRDGKPIDKSYMLGLEAAHLIVMACVPERYRLYELRWDEYSSLSSTTKKWPSHDCLAQRRATLRRRADAAIDTLIYNGAARTVLKNELDRLDVAEV
jgi:deoxyadenosine/deoxycytidine kinase